MHAEKNYPIRKIPSDLDIGLPDSMEDSAYLEMLGAHLPRLLDAIEPDLVFFNAGVGNFQVAIPGFGTVTGPFKITALQYDGPHDGEVKISLSLASAGALTFAGL